MLERSCNSSTYIDNLINSCGLYQRLGKLYPQKGAGLDELPPLLLKNCCAGFTYPFSILLKKFLACFVLSDLWKKCVIIPIYKTGDK